MKDKKFLRCGGKLLYSAVEYINKNKPEMLRSSIEAVGVENAYKVFSDDSLVQSCMSLCKNDLNVSLAAQQLYMHRNTLIYRIKKVERLIGVNVSTFDGAVSFLILYHAYKNNIVPKG